MTGEILSIDTAEKISAMTKELEREKRNKKILELENKELIKKVARLDNENYYLNKRNKTLIALEESLPQRIETYKKKTAPESIIKELQFFVDILMFEKEKILNGGTYEKE